MVSLFDKANKMKNHKPMTIAHQEFLKRIKKSLYLGPSNPNRMLSSPLASHVSERFNETHRNYSLNTLDLDSMSRIRQATPASLIISIIYLDRLNKLDPNFVKLVSPSELFLVAMMLSTKFYSDYDEGMEVFISQWAKEGRVEAERLKQLEISFLNAMQWNLTVGQNEFYEKLKTVERILAMKEGLARGWYTYTELEMLMPSLEIAKRILNYTTILMFSYALSIATIALSSVIVASIPATTDVATNGTAPSTFPMIALQPTDERTFDNLVMMDLADPKSSRNFTLNFPLLDAITRWETKRNYQDVNFGFMNARKFETVPLPW